MINISRHYRTDHLEADNIETKILIYEDQIRGWFLDQACILRKVSDHAGFVILLIVLSFIEGHAIFLKGRNSTNHSKEFFRDAFLRIFELDTEDTKIKKDAANELYDQMRNGLFHTGIVKGKVRLVPAGQSAVRFTINKKTETIDIIEVTPSLMLTQIEDYFSKYMMRLRNPDETDLRNHFEIAWNMRNN